MISSSVLQCLATSEQTNILTTLSSFWLWMFLEWKLPFFPEGMQIRYKWLDVKKSP